MINQVKGLDTHVTLLAKERKKRYIPIICHTHPSRFTQGVLLSPRAGLSCRLISTSCHPRLQLLFNCKQLGSICVQLEI